MSRTARSARFSRLSVSYDYGRIPVSDSFWSSFLEIILLLLSTSMEADCHIFLIYQIHRFFWFHIPSISLEILYIFSNVTFTFWNTWFRKYYKCLKILQVLQSIQMLNSSYFAQKFGLRIKCFSGTPLYVTWKEFVDTQVSHSRSLKAESEFKG